MRQYLKQDRVAWLDIENPQPEDLKFLEENFGIHNITIDELKSASSRSKADIYNNYTFLVFYVPVFDKEERTVRPVELDIIITKDTFITVRYKKLEIISSFVNKCSYHPKLKESCFSNSVGELFYWFFEDILEFSLRQAAHIGQNIDILEKNIFQAGNEKKVLWEILAIKRELLDFKKIINWQLSVLKSIVNKPEVVFEKDLEYYLNDLYEDWGKIWRVIDNYKDTAESLENTNSAILSHKINNTISILTIFSAILLTITLITTIFGFFFNHLFNTGAIVAVIALFLMLLIFKKKKWL